MSQENSMGVLPDGWSVQSLSLAADVVMGQSPPGASYNEDGVGAPFFQGKAEFGQMYPTVRKWTTAGNKHAKVGDILLSVRAPVGPTNVADIDCVIGRGLAAIRAKKHMNQVFLLWFLRSFEHEIAAKGTGTTFDSISGDALRNHLINVPPLEEQEKIVEILEEQLSRLDAALESVRAVRAKAARFRRSLLNSTLNGIVIDSMGMVEKLPLSDCAEMSLGIMLDKAKGSGAYLTPYMGNINVRWGEFNQTDLKLMDIKPEQMERSLARKGDVIVCEGGEPGRTAVWNNEQPVAIQKALHRVRPFAEMNSNFIGYCLELEFRGVSEHQLFTGTTIKHLPKEKLKTLRIPKPPLQEQEKIVEILEEQLSRLNASLAVAEEIERKSSALRRSLLHAAFTGELTKEWREGAHV